MAFFKVNQYAHSLGYQNQYSVYIPDSLNTSKQVDVVYLYHGMWGNRIDFERYNIDMLAEKFQVVLVFVEVHNSYYLNTLSGERFYDYVSEEIPTNLNRIFGLQVKTNSVIGISMGGYGAMYVGLNKKYDNIANLSGAVILQNRIDNTDDKRFAWVIKELKNEHCIEKLLLNQVESRIYSYCGTNDFLWEDNYQINQLIVKNGCDYKISSDDGDHNFESWNNQIPQVFNYFFGGQANDND